MIAAVSPHVVVLLTTILWSPSGAPTISVTRQPTVQACERLRDDFESTVAAANLASAPALVNQSASRCDVLPSEPVKAAI